MPISNNSCNALHCLHNLYFFMQSHSQKKKKRKRKKQKRKEMTTAFLHKGYNPCVERTVTEAIKTEQVKKIYFLKYTVTYGQLTPAALPGHGCSGAEMALHHCCTHLITTGTAAKK